jgi:FkbM family methyltransferase
METHGKTDVFISTAIEDSGNWEASGTAVVLQLLRSGGDFIDIGANLGWYTLLAGHALSGRGHVHSFEPEPSNLVRLKANVALNRLGNVTVNDWALSDRSGSATLHLNHVNRGDNSLFAMECRPSSATVKVNRLDDYRDVGCKRPLIIKLDVQGSEIDVLNGARRLLQTYPREVVLLCEVSPLTLGAAGRTVSELTTLLEELRFAGAVVDRQRPRVFPMSWQDVTEAADRDSSKDLDVVAYRRVDGLMAPLLGSSL